jgi:type VI secretion system protein VasD
LSRAINRLACAFAVLAAALGAAGCAAKAPVVEPPPAPVSVVVTASATPDANPDAEGRASPVLVRVYQLADATAFTKAELLPLWDQEAATLAASLVGRHELRLEPGGDGEVGFELDPRVRSIAVAAAYRDFRSASWRAVAPVPERPVPGTTLRLVVDVESRTVAARWQ